jgi:hypothetical protein
MTPAMVGTTYVIFKTQEFYSRVSLNVNLYGIGPNRSYLLPSSIFIEARAALAR